MNNLSITPGTNNVGAYINNIDLKNLNQDQAKEIKKILNQFGVIFIKEQNLDPGSYQKFAKNIGQPVIYPRLKGLNKKFPFINVIERKPEDKNLSFGSSWLHQDTSYLANDRPRYTMLMGIEIPKGQGNTIFSSGYNAYEKLPSEIKEKIQDAKGTFSSAGPISITRLERKKELQKFIRIEQAEVRKEQANKQRKFLEQIRLEKKIEQFRKREAIEIKNLEKFVLSQERESYTEVQERIEKIKQKYQALRDQKIRERVEQLGVKVEEGDDRSVLLEKERQYNVERQKIEFALESFYRSAHSLCFQINKRYIPKYLSILRVIDRRYETGEVFIKWDDAPDEDWLILIYIKNNSPEEGIVIEDKTNINRNNSLEFKSSDIFKASDMMVDALTNLLDRERKKRQNN
tara:strand:- start:1113 stop:2321 length:1209 start_codon:yes stop_codon:yes gene_type:complete